MKAPYLRTGRVLYKIVHGESNISQYTRMTIIEHLNNLRGIYTQRRTLPWKDQCMVMAKGTKRVFISLDVNKDLTYKRHKERFEKEGYTVLGVMSREEVNKKHGSLNRAI